MAQWMKAALAVAGGSVFVLGYFASTVAIRESRLERTRHAIATGVQVAQETRGVRETQASVPIGTEAATPTLAQPSSPPAPTATPGPVWAPFEGPVRVRGYEPPPLAPVAREGMYVYVLLGIDWVDGRRSYNSDTFILVIVDAQAGHISLVSIPRDLLVYAPGIGMVRLNAVYALGGPDALHQTVLYNFGLWSRGYVAIHMRGFTRVVDLLGGISVTPVVDLQERCNRAPFNLAAGRTYRLNGTQALCYARNRGGGDDFDRMPRQQQVIESIVAELKGRVTPATLLTTGADLYDVYKAYVETDIALRQEVPVAASLLTRPYQTCRYVVGREMVTGFSDPDLGSHFLRPPRTMRALVEAATLCEPWPSD